jgi:hypothetical protein
MPQAYNARHCERMRNKKQRCAGVTPRNGTEQNEKRAFEIALS